MKIIGKLFFVLIFLSSLSFSAETQKTEGGRYQAVSGDKMVMILDTQTGKVWMWLNTSSREAPSFEWCPYDLPKDVAKFPMSIKQDMEQANADRQREKRRPPRDLLESTDSFIPDGDSIDFVPDSKSNSPPKGQP